MIVVAVNRKAGVDNLNRSALSLIHISVEVSSVSVEDRNLLDRMAPGVADAIARGSSAFRPLYVVAAVNPGDRP